MKKHIVLTAFLTILLFAFYTSNTQAIENDSTKSIKGVTISYWGNMVNTQGVQVGIEKYMFQNEKFKAILTTTLNFSGRKEINTNMGIWIGSSLRRTYSKGFFFEHGIKAGYLGSYYKFDFYKLNKENEFVNIGKRWTSSIVMGYSFGIGYDFSKISSFDMQLSIKPNLYYRFPNNDNVFFLNNYGFEAGVTFHPKWFR